jgi:hypothetical protein
MQNQKTILLFILNIVIKIMDIDIDNYQFFGIILTKTTG